MPEDVGGSPFPDGREPDDDRGGADDEFATVVFDEEFIRSAPVHEPSAVERLLAAAEAESRRSRRARRDGLPYAGPGDRGHHPDIGDLYEPDFTDDHDPRRPFGSRARWHRPVAWLLALVMGVGMVALAFAAVYRGSSSGRQDQIPPPASTEVDTVSPKDTSAASSGPPVPALPRTP